LVDWDVFAVDNFDELFSYSTAAAMAYWPGTPEPDPNSGVLVSHPSTHIFEKMVSALSLLGPDYNSPGAPPLKHGVGVRYGQQAFLTHFFWRNYYPGHNLTELSMAYNAGSRSIDKIKNDLSKEGRDVKLVHFTVQKPYRDDMDKEVRNDSAIIPILCEFTLAAHQTIAANPGLVEGSGKYQSRLHGWEELVANPKFVAWARRNCKNLPGTSERRIMEADVPLKEAHDEFLRAVA